MMEELIKELKEKEHYSELVDQCSEDLQGGWVSERSNDDVDFENTEELEIGQPDTEPETVQELDLSDKELVENNAETEKIAGEPSLNEQRSSFYGTEFVKSLVDRMEREYPTIFSTYQHICDEQFILFMRKHLDYGMENIAAGTSLDTAEDANFALQGIWYRLSDKVNRWKNIMKNGGVVLNEPILDTLQDIANYAIIAQLVARGLWKKG